MLRWCAFLLALSFPSASLAHEELLSVGPFSLTERSGKTVTREDLRGKIWVAHFFYCTCAEGCAQTTANMAKLQAVFARHENFRLVSIHVGAEREDRDLLKQYASDHGADPERWLFLTGPEKEVHQIVQKSFFQPAERNPAAKPGFD